MAQVMTPLDLRQVQVRGEIGRRIDLAVSANLLQLEVDRDFLAPFRAKSLESGYIGLGKLIDATVRFAAYTGDPEVLRLKEQLVAGALEAQDPDGYLGILVPESRIWGVFDTHETSHLVYGLANDYRFFGEQASLGAARRLADYILDRWEAEPDRWPGWGEGGRPRMYGVTLGLDPALLTLYEQTGDSRYLDFCTTFKQCALPRWDSSPKIGGPDACMDDERHCYIFMALCTAQMQLHALRPDPALLAQAHKALDFLTREEGLLVSGSCSKDEGWHSDQDGSGQVSESCATAYLIRMLDRLLRAEGHPGYGDMMERAIYNALFAAQAPEGRSLRYFTALEGERTYFDRDTFCCPNNWRRIMAELPGMVYYRRGNGATVNLYVDSSAEFDLAEGLSLRLRQETDYPSSGEVEIHLDPSAPDRFPLYLRIPRWCDQASVTVNGQAVEGVVEPGKLLALERTWEPGDTVRLRLPLEFRWVRGRQSQAGRAALLRGPVLFCLNPARNEGLEGVDLREITVDPASVEGPSPDDTVRPGGQACRVRGWSPEGAELTLLLTEFVNPGGEATHLRITPDAAHSLVNDELVG